MSLSFKKEKTFSSYLLHFQYIIKSKQHYKNGKNLILSTLREELFEELLIFALFTKSIPFFKVNFFSKSIQLAEHATP